jgi:hypothetical protein
MCIRRGHRKKDQGRTFLDGGSVPLEPDEDDLTIMTVATPAPDKDDGTYETPSK